ncbi:hypothetical protein [Clostridium sp. BJN0013]|uniref:hypothetical protein n=1 Tax=Clostridium sp. BJN0013 TaxID=3236840 RepID=UPI0034C6754E
MLTFLFLLLIIGNAVILYRFSDKVSSQRRQIISLKYENDSLKSKLSKEFPRRIDVNYITPQNLSGIVTIKTSLYLAPTLKSSIVNILEENTLLKIEDAAKIQNQLWYEISLNGINRSSRINSKGWVKSNYIKIT